MTDAPLSNCHPAPWRADAVRYRMVWRLVPSVNHKLIRWNDLQALAVDFGVGLQRTTAQIAFAFTLAT